METRCQKCDAEVSGDQAFCQRCGAVVGMSDATSSSDEGWNLAATMVNKQEVRPRPSAERPSLATQAEAAPARKGGNTVMLAVIGFVVVLFIGGLLILLLYLNSQR